MYLMYALSARVAVVVGRGVVGLLCARNEYNLMIVNNNILS